MLRKPELHRSEDVTDALTRIIGAIDVVKSAVPLQLGQGILATTAAILIVVKDTIKNKDDFRDLISQCDWIRELIQKSNWGVDQAGGSPMLIEAMKELSGAVDRTHAQVTQRDERKLYRRFLSSSVDKDKIKEMTTHLDRSLKHFALRLHMIMTESLRKIEQELTNTKSDNPRKAVLPPPRPTIFRGRNGLVSRVCGTLLSRQGSERRHVALLGPGGIGKSSLAKAVLNERSIKTTFKNRRFFIPFDDILASQVTYSTFVERVSRILGIATTEHHGISEYVRGDSTLIVLDNAETFLDPDVSHDASRIKRAIDEVGSFACVSILITSRSRELPRGLRCLALDIPNLDAQSAYEAFKEIYHGEVSTSRPSLDQILHEVGYHPLTINLLAHAAQVNRWTISALTKHWNVRRSRLLNSGRGKDESLADSVQLSLNAPCVRVHGEDVERILRIIAFFPQGIPREKLQLIFPSVTDIHEIADVLHRQSLLIFNGEFVTMLAPIRIYATDAIPGPDPHLLTQARSYYAGLLRSPGASWDSLSAEDVNVESLIAYDLRTFPEGTMAEALDACTGFINYLRAFKSRPTSLRPAIESAGTASPNGTTSFARMRCLRALSNLSFERSNYLEALELSNISRDLAEKLGSFHEAIDFLQYMADAYRLLGQYNACREMLQRAQVMMDQRGAGPRHQAVMYLQRGYIQHVSDAHIDGASSAAGFQESQRLFELANDSTYGVFSAAEVHFTLALVDNNTVAARRGLEYGIARLQNVHPPRSGITFLYTRLSTVALMEGNFEECEQLLRVSRTYYIRERRMAGASEVLLDLSILAVALGDITRAVDLFNQAREELRIHHIVSDRKRWLMLYTSGVLKLVSGRLLEANQFFEQAKRYCEAHQEFQVRALSTRAMGEIAYLQKDSQKAKALFEAAAAICREVGILPNLLYRRGNLAFFQRVPPATYEGWPLFLRGGSF